MPTAGASEKSPNTAPNGAAHSHVAEIQEIVDRVWEKYKNVENGEVATYIPELRNADPKHFGICVALADGQVFRAGIGTKNSRSSPGLQAVRVPNGARAMRDGVDAHARGR